MARLFRLWVKKRGERRTGSSVAGSLGEALFFAVLFLLGAVALAAVLTAQFTAGPGAAEAGAEGVAEPPLSGWSLWLVLLVLASFLIIGGVGFVLSLLHLGASVERRTALINRARNLEIIGQGASSAPQYPTVPRSEELTDSPGTTLDYRLPVVQSPVWRLAAAAVFCLLWNSATAVMVVLAIENLLRQAGDWLLTGCAAVMLAVAAWSIYYFVRQLFEHTGVGPTSVEISDLPLRPGRSYEVFLSQAGQITFDRLQILLVCEEQATYSQGTNVRTETEQVHGETIFQEKSLTVAPGQPCERRCSLKVPDDAMHSFHAAHNAVHWKLVVRGRAQRRAAFERTFPVVVYPRPNEMNVA